MPSICMLSDDFVPAATGVGTHVQRVAQDLAARGHRVSVVTTRRRGQQAREEWNGVRVHRVFTVPVFGFYQALPSRRTLRRLFVEEGVEVAHFHYLGILLRRAQAVARAMRIPTAYTYHMTADHLTQPAPMKPLRPWIERQIVRHCNRFDLVIAPSRGIIDRIRSEGVRAPTRYISNPVAFASAPDAPAAREPGFLVLYAGRLDPEKNVGLLLRAFARVATARADARLMVAGAGSQRERLEAECSALGVEDRVRFTGFIPREELARLYLACDAFVLPSLVEVQPLVAMEAMHFGRPVLMARSIVAAPELVAEGISGYIVDPREPGELADRLLALAADPVLRARMGEAGRARTAGFEPARVADELEDAYRGLLSR